MTPTGLASLRSAAQSTKPWLSSTGPRTEAGKAVSRMNALQHGERSARRVAERREIGELFRMARTHDRIAAEHLAGALERRGLPPENIWAERLTNEIDAALERLRL